MEADWACSRGLVLKADRLVIEADGLVIEADWACYIEADWACYRGRMVLLLGRENGLVVEPADKLDQVVKDAEDVH